MSETVTESCGCVFCDLGLFRHLGTHGYFHRRANGELTDCTKPFVSDNLRAITDKEAGQ